MPSGNSAIARMALYAILALSGYIAGMCKGRYLYYEAGKLTGCSKMAGKMFGGLGRCVMVKNDIALELIDNNGIKNYFLLDR